MNIKQIKYFMSAAQHDSLSAAAKEQYVTVQAVSKAIADLERELGSQLLIRESRGVKLTTFGVQFYQKAEGALRSFAELETFAQNYAANNVKCSLRLMLCTPRFHTTEKACKSIRAFLEKYLNVEASVILGSARDCHESLANHSIDGFVTVGLVSEPGIECMTIGTVSPAVIMMRNHPYTKKASVTLKDLQKYPFHVARKFDYFYDAVLSGFRDHPDFPPIENLKSSSRSMLSFFLRGDMTACPCISSLGELFPGTVIRPFSFDESVAIPICLNYPQGGKTQVLTALEHLLKNDLFLFSFGGGNGFE